MEHEMHKMMMEMKGHMDGMNEMMEMMSKKMGMEKMPENPKTMRDKAYKMMEEKKK